MEYEQIIQREVASRSTLRKKNLRSNLTGVAFSAPFIVLFLMFMVYPFFYGIYITFFNWKLTQPDLSVFVGIKNYVRIFGDPNFIYSRQFWQGLQHTSIFAALTIPFVVFLPLLLAFLINLKPWGYKVFRNIFFLPSVISITAVGIIWKYVFATGNGFLNAVITDLGGQEIPFLTDSFWAWFVLVFVTVWWTIGTNMVIFQAGLQEIDKSLYEAASTDGAGGWSKFIHITLPGLRNQFVICFITTTIAEFNIYGQSLMITMGGPGKQTYMLMMYIRDLMMTNGQTGFAATMGLLMGIILIVLSLLQKVLLKERKGRVRREIKKA